MQANRLEAHVVARNLLARAGPASLATVAADGSPFASYVLSAPGRDGWPILLLSRLAVHTSNLLRDSRASLLLVHEPGHGAGPAAAERLTLVGRALEHADQASAGAAFLAHHPEAARYAGFADFRYFAFVASTAHVVAGFGVIAELSVAQLGSAPNQHSVL